VLVEQSLEEFGQHGLVERVDSVTTAVHAGVVELSETASAGGMLK